VESGRLLSNVCQACEEKAAEALRLAAPQPAKAGDLVAKVTSALGIPTCGACAKRQAAMNQVDFSKPAMEVLSGLFEAITNPDKSE
jgi:hypothetical protein